MRTRTVFLTFCLAVLSHCAIAQAANGGFTISGVVVDDRSSQPLANTSVSIAPTRAEDQSRSVVTGSNGHFEFTGLAPGKYSLAGKRRGYLAQGYDQHEQYATAIAVGPQQDSTHLIFRLHPDASIHGRILDENNEPAPEMQVWLFNTRNDLGRRSTRLVAQAQTNDLGEYSFAHLGEGTYYLLAMGRPWYASGGPNLQQESGRDSEGNPLSLGDEHDQIVREESERLDKSYPLTFYDNETDWTQASGIDLAPGDRFTADFRVNTVPAASIRLPSAPSNEPGNGSQGIPRIYLQAKVFDDQLIPINVDYQNGPNGEFAAGGIAPGHYVMQVHYPNEEHASTQEIDLAGSIDLPRPSGATTAAVNGKFVWEGTPVTRGVGVVLSNSRTNRNYFCMPKANGEFTVAESVMPGNYEVAVGSQRGDIYVKSVQVAGVTSTGPMVRVPNGGDLNMTITLSHGTGTIDGIALLDGKPKAGVMVVLVPAEGWVGVTRFRRDQSDSDGTFTLRDVVPGNYKVVALRDGWKLPWSDPKTMKTYLTEGTPVRITGNEKPNITVKVK